jgi:hypothetical protein
MNANECIDKICKLCLGIQFKYAPTFAYQKGQLELCEKILEIIKEYDNANDR